MTDAKISDRTKPAAPAPTDARTAVDRHSWLGLMSAIGAEEGYFRPIGSDHWAFCVEDGDTLLVSFETLAQARARAGQMPLAHFIAAARGWSHLCLIADGETWYRDRSVFEYFDHLVDESFFDGFEQVMFYGAGMGGYAACAYAVTAPGATVLALNPRATLDPAEAGWDRRSPRARLLNFTDRYGYAPEMLEGSGNVFVIHDPAIAEEAMHASLFRARFITRLSARLAGDNLEAAFDEMAVLENLIAMALTGELDQLSFAKIWRQRRDFLPYLESLYGTAVDAGRRPWQAAICRNIAGRIEAPLFAERLASLDAP